MTYKDVLRALFLRHAPMTSPNGKISVCIHRWWWPISDLDNVVFMNAEHPEQYYVLWVNDPAFEMKILEAGAAKTWVEAMARLDPLPDWGS